MTVIELPSTADGRAALKDAIETFGGTTDPSGHSLLQTDWDLFAKVTAGEDLQSEMEDEVLAAWLVGPMLPKLKPLKGDWHRRRQE